MQLARLDEDVRIMALAAIGETVCAVDSAGNVHVGNETLMNKVSNLPKIVVERALFLSVAGEGNFFLVGSSNGFLVVFDGTRHCVLDYVSVHQSGVNAIVAAGGGCYVSVSDDQSIAVTHVCESGKLTLCQRIVNASSCSIRAVACKGSRIVTTGTDRRVSEWTLANNQLQMKQSTIVSVTDPLSILVLDNNDLLVAGRGIERIVIDN